MKAFSFRKGERLLRRAEFQQLSRSGNRIESDHFVIRYTPNDLGTLRLGVTVSKRVGCAVIRNRVKRLVREHFRLHKAMFSNYYDVNVIAKDGISNLPSREIREALAAIVHDISRNCSHEAVPAGTH